MQDTKTAFQNFVTQKLNPEQQQAVTHKDGSLLIIAGAGSGKTRVITARIAHLMLNENIGAHEIVALTFTNKAAKEMQERITHFIRGEFNTSATPQHTRTDASLPFVGTFHSYCLRLLKTHQELLDTPFFSILDADDQEKIVSGIIARNHLQKQVTAKQLLYQISHIKNHLQEPTLLQEMYAANPMLEAIYLSYEKEKKASKCLDFDDLLIETVKLFQKNKEFKKEFQETVRHVLVDEYQDTNVVQHELLKLMTKDARNSFTLDSLCVVGDEDQSIYSWRGATVANMVHFKKDFPKTTIIKLEQNYRSAQPILELANKVITHNTQRNPKNLWSDKKGKDRIRLISCISEYQEGDSIVYLIQTAIAQKQSLSSIAVLYRTHFQSRAIEEALIKHSVPYKIIGGVQFYERKEIKDLLAYLRLVANPFDRPSLFRVINTPNKGLGQKFEELFYGRWTDEPFLTFTDVAHKLIEEGQVTGTKKAALLEFIKTFDGLKSTDKPTAALDAIITRTGYLSYLKESYELQDAQDRIDNIKELLNAIKHFESTNANTVELFLHEVTLMQDALNKNDAKKDTVVLMTLHAAKGLEFDTVIITGLEEGLLPSSRSMASMETLEEERRLFYVGITRAKERLLLTHSRYRYAYRTMTDQRPSRFLNELPKELVQHEDASYWKQMEFRALFSTWMGARATAPASSPVMTFGTVATAFGASNGPSKSTSRIGGHVKNSAEKSKNISTFNGAQKASAKITNVSKPTFKGTARTTAPATPKKAVSTGNKTQNFGGFKINQPVQHSTFGTGIIKEIEVKNDATIFVTVNFKGGTKKIDSKFLKVV